MKSIFTLTKDLQSDQLRKKKTIIMINIWKKTGLLTGTDEAMDRKDRLEIP